MSHRVDFNVHRYGKSVQWNFSMPSTDISMTWRVNYILTYWIRAVCKVYGIQTFKLFFTLDSEFPRAKIIGYRQLYFKPVNIPYRFTSILKSGTRVEHEDMLPFTDGSSQLAGLDVLKKVQFTKKLRRIGKPSKILRAIYDTRTFPIINGGRAGRELTNLFFFESYCQRYGEVLEGDEVVNAQELRDSGAFGWGDYDSAGFFTLHAAHFSFMDIAAGALASMCMYRAVSESECRKRQWKEKMSNAGKIFSSLSLFTAGKNLVLGTGSSDLYRFTVAFRHIFYATRTRAYGRESLTTNQVFSLLALSIALKKIKQLASLLRAVGAIKSTKRKTNYLKFFGLLQFFLGFGSCSSAHAACRSGFLPAGDTFDVQDWGLVFFKTKLMGIARQFRRGECRAAANVEGLDYFYALKVSNWSAGRSFLAERGGSAVIKRREFGSRFVFSLEKNLLLTGASAHGEQSRYEYDELGARNATKLLGRQVRRINLLLKKTKLSRNINELSRTDYNRFEESSFRDMSIADYTTYGTRYRKPMLLVDELAQALTIEGVRDESRNEVDMSKLQEQQRKMLRGLLPAEVDAGGDGAANLSLEAIYRKMRSAHKDFVSSPTVKNDLNKKSGLLRSGLRIRKILGVILAKLSDEKKKKSTIWGRPFVIGHWGHFAGFLKLAERALASLRRKKSNFSWGLHKKMKIDCADFFFGGGAKVRVQKKLSNLRSFRTQVDTLRVLAVREGVSKTSFGRPLRLDYMGAEERFVSVNPGKTEGRGYCEGPAVRDILVYNIDTCAPSFVIKPLLFFKKGPHKVWTRTDTWGDYWWGPKREEISAAGALDASVLRAVHLTVQWFASVSGAKNWLGAEIRGSEFLLSEAASNLYGRRHLFYGNSPSTIFSVGAMGSIVAAVSDGADIIPGSAEHIGARGSALEEPYIAGERERTLMPYTLEEKFLLHNLRGLFFAVFGICFDIQYYPIGRVFASDKRMQHLASGLAEFVRVHVSSNRALTGWLNEFTTIYYASIFTRSTEAMVRFMAVRFKYELYWPRILGLMFKVVKSLALREFGIAGIKIGFHGVFGGQPRAFRLAKIWGVNPCLRNGLLTGSHSSAQCLSKYGVVHIHIWLTYF